MLNFYQHAWVFPCVQKVKSVYWQPYTHPDPSIILLFAHVQLIVIVSFISVQCTGDEATKVLQSFLMILYSISEISWLCYLVIVSSGKAPVLESHFFIAITPRPLWPWNTSTCLAPIYIYVKEIYWISLHETI